MPPQTTPKVLPFAPQGAGSLDYWKGQLEWSAEVRKKKLPSWRTHVQAYQGGLAPTRVGGIRVNIEFEKTEQKKPQLFFRLPVLKLRATPRTLRDAAEAGKAAAIAGAGGGVGPGGAPRDLKKAIAILREVLTYQLGPKGANTKALMDEIIFDVLCPSGIAFCKIGYERYTEGTVPIQIGVEPDPTFQQPGAILNLSGMAPLRPVMADAPNIVCEQYYASRISPARGLVPAEFMGSDYNKADFLAYDFLVTPDAAKRRGWAVDGKDIQASDRAAVDQDDRIVKLEETGRRTGLIQCREAFYYPANIGQADNPDRIRRLVFVGGKAEPVIHEDYRDQKWSAQGKWIGGLKTLPIKVYTLRYVSDTALPPSDCEITRRAVDEVSEFRTNQMIHRRKAVPRSAVDISRFINEQQKTKFLNGDLYDDIAVDGRTDNVSTPIGPPNIPPDNYKSEAELKNDIDRAWAMGGNSSSVKEGGSPTATEIVTIAQATANRLSAEREQTVRFWLSLAEGIAALVQMYADREDYVEITGETGAKQIEAWDRDTIAGEFLFDVIPDSSLPPDGAADRDLALNFHNLVANSPYLDGEQELRDLTEAFGRDPDRLVHPPPPPPPPEKPRVSLAISGKDLDPATPQYQNVVNVLTALGVSAQPPAASPAAAPSSPEAPIGPAPVIDRERLRMAESDEADRRAGGLAGVGA